MKRILKITLLFALIFMNMFFITGCWNYREIDKLAIVAGAAIDKEDDKYLVTVEIVNLTGGKEAKIEPKTIMGKGDTIFDAARNVIEISGKKLYWSHVKVVIVSQEIAREGIIQVIDWFNRDTETRISTNLLISKEKTAKELLEQQSVTSEVRSIEMNDMLIAQKSLSKAPTIAVYKFVNALAAQGKSAVLPAIGITVNEGRRTSELCGTAVFKGDKLIGFLDGEDTKYFLFIINKAKGGLLIQKERTESSYTNVALEIFSELTSTKIKPVYSNGKLTMKLDVHVNAAIGEIEGAVNYINEAGRAKLKKDAEESLRDNIKRVIKKVQNDYGSDIFGFGSIVKGDKPNVWKDIEGDWEKIYKDLEVNVNVDIDITNSALAVKPIKKGD